MRDDGRPRWYSLRSLGWLPLFVCLLISLGFGGCRSDSGSAAQQASQTQQDTEEEKKTAKPKPNIETKPPVLLPGVFERQAEWNRAKPGHWAVAQLPIVSNTSDMNVELATYAVTSANFQPVAVPGTPFYIRTTRAASLPKEEDKVLETLVFLPIRKEKATAVTVRLDLLTAAGLSVHTETQPVQVLQPFQNHILVVSRAPESFRVLRLIDAVAIPVLGASVAPAFYNVVLPTPNYPLPLPRSALAWTSIAYLVWDDFSPQDLDAAQQQALLDWLHFGGQLVINGPTSMQWLRGSFVDSLLPAEMTGTRNISDADLKELNAYWSIPLEKDPARRRELSIPESAPMLGVDLLLRREGRFVAGTGGLVAERPVGRGRIVLTGLDLRDRRVRAWQSFSGFVHGALFRRPPRVFAKSDWDELSFRWRDNDSSLIFDPLVASTLRFISRDLSHAGTAPHIDWHMPLSDASTHSAGRFQGRLPDDEPLSYFVLPGSLKRNLSDNRFFGGFDSDDQAGTGGWNDHKGIALAAREILANAAGITPPTRKFVLRILLGYLAVLALVNWGFFKVIGRVEWAWVAMPVLAVVGTFVVVRSAQLDIGFVRSETKVGVLELHGGYPRGHLTQYTGLYSSLSTRFTIDFPTNSGLAAPFSYRATPTAETLNAQPIQLRRGAAHQFRNILVQSNSTGMTHEEDFVELAGAIQVFSQAETWTLANRSQLDLQSAGVVWRETDDSYRLAWLGRFEPGQTRALEFITLASNNLYNSWRSEPSLVSDYHYCRKVWLDVAQAAADARLSDDLLAATEDGNNAPRRDNDPLAGLLSLRQLLAHREIARIADSFSKMLVRKYPQRAYSSTEPKSVRLSFREFLDVYSLVKLRETQSAVNLGPIFDVVADQLQLAVGEMRLLARVDDPVGSQRLTPLPTRSRQGTLVVVHLQFGEWPAAQPDTNTLFDFARQSDLDALLDEQGSDDRRRLESLLLEGENDE